MIFLQSFVLPVCSYHIDHGRATVDDLFGSAFFMNSSGIFLTARHVIESAIVNAKKKDRVVGLCQKQDAGRSAKSGVADIIAYEFAPEPYDIAIGRSSAGSESLLTLAPHKVEVWQDVAAYGYPLSITDMTAERISMNLRAHKGYIQRLIPPGELKISKNPDAFELSFSLSRGLSGSPLFIHREPKDIVIGVCVGTIRTEETDFELTEVDDAGCIYKESRLKIEQFGMAHDIRPLHSWKPKLLEGLTLLEIASR